ncbi:hypothetical protein IMSHALPRED_007133 [Imshaugia aleurites]|uniref:Uncharacterized protein n=1 Tax=Imshaugia aleurites TaxID=172621 RepID=A0A8H3IPZ4_9LECA|nr:hypothetical protein IMSHALPRED_007133 [Imshaugia aleurites]
MSHIPILTNELFPWPRIHFGEALLTSTAVNQQTAFPRLHRGSSQLSGNLSSSTKPRARASSDAGPVLATSPFRGRSTSFGSTQEYGDLYSSGPVQRFDRKISDRKVQDLLKLRKQKLKEAERKGDEVEVFRLKNLNLFEDIERLESNNDAPKRAKLTGDFTGQSDHHDFLSRTDVLDFAFISQPKSVHQGHTATLCWQLKLQLAQGLMVPEEFSSCNIHPTPSPCASSSSSFTLQPASPSSLNSGSKRSSRLTKGSSTYSSTLRDSSGPSTPAAGASTAIAADPSSPTKCSSNATKTDEEDTFLYIAKYIKRHAKDSRHSKETKRSCSQASSADIKRSSHIPCSYSNHDYRTYLSGPPSKHCRSCKLPRLQPEVAAATGRMEKMKESVLARANTNIPAEESSEADEFRKFEIMQEDLKLVEMYNAETEKRCRNGVWWEGWLIVEDLKRQGIVGSKPFVYDRGDSVA